MPKMMSHYTELARRRETTAPQDILAAIPATTPDPLEDSLAAATGLFAGVVGLITAAVGALAVLVRRRAKNAHSEVAARSVLIVIRETEVDLVKVKWFGRGLGQTLSTYPHDIVRYYRTDLAVDTRMMIAGREWAVHGWFERDLREVLRPLGIQLEQLPTPISYKEIDP